MEKAPVAGTGGRGHKGKLRNELYKKKKTKSFRKGGPINYQKRTKSP